MLYESTRRIMTHKFAITQQCRVGNVFYSFIQPSSEEKSTDFPIARCYTVYITYTRRHTSTQNGVKPTLASCITFDMHVIIIVK